VDTQISKQQVRAWTAVAAIVVVSLLHYFTSTGHFWLHEFFQRAYYVPVILSALWYGWRGGILAATLSGVLYAPHILMSWQSHPEYSAAQYIEIGMFLVVGGLTGILSDHERMQRKQVEETARKLSKVNAQLQASFEQLRRADRLSALGELSAGLAHEIRNPLGALEGAVQILQRPELPTDTRHEFVEMAGKEVGRLKALLTSFLDFARPQPPEKTLIEPVLLLESVVRLAAETAKMAKVQILVEAQEAAPIAVDAEQIKQVLLNLVLNAVQAMPEGGQVVLRARQEDGSVLLEIADQGSGIAPENLERIFDPFFTTRASGTGLGLSIAHQIVHGHGGQISVHNNQGRGATFTVILPLAASQPETSAVSNVRA
jgi:two-component system sensor histidine kinase HydH